MSRITASSDMDNVKTEELSKYIDLFCQDVTQTINGKLDFATNFNCKLVTVLFLAANTDTAVPHGLGRVASNYFPVSKSVSCDIYSGSGGSSSSMNLKSTVVPATVTLVVF